MKNVGILLLSIVFSINSLGQDINSLKNLAKKGEAQAQFQLGERYNKGEDVKRDRKTALKWYKKAADNGYVEAQLKYGRELTSLWNDEKAIQKGKEYLRMASNQGNLEATHLLAILEFNDYNYEEYLNLITKGAVAGHLESQSSLGNVLIFSIGGYSAMPCFVHDVYVLPHDISLGLKWLRIAAEKGDKSAYKSLGICYLYGLGVEYDNQIALEYLTNAEDADKFIKLAKEFQEQEEDYVKNFKRDKLTDSGKLSLEKAEKGDDFHMGIVAQLFKDGKENFPKNFRMYVYWLMKSAENGSYNAMNEIGKNFIDGENKFPVCIGEGLNWFRLAANYGHYNGLAGFYKKTYKYGKEEAIHWLKLEADRRYKEDGINDYFTRSALDDLRKLGVNYTPRGYVPTTQNFISMPMFGGGWNFGGFPMFNVSIPNFNAPIPNFSVPSFNTLPNFNFVPDFNSPVFVPSDNYSAPSNSTSEMNSSNNSGSTHQKTRHPCRLCNQQGRRIKMIYASGPDKWCSECQKTVPPGHFHEQCENCRGQGYTEY